jgi:hypothetical protein
MSLSLRVCIFFFNSILKLSLKPFYFVFAAAPANQVNDVFPILVNCSVAGTFQQEFLADIPPSGFRRYVDEICAVLGYYATSSGSCLLTFRDNISVHPRGSGSSRRLLDPRRWDRTLSRNVGKGWPLDAARCPKRAYISLSVHLTKLAVASVVGQTPTCAQCTAVRALHMLSPTKDMFNPLKTKRICFI